MKVRDILAQKGGDVVTVAENARLSYIARVLHGRHIGVVVVRGESVPVIGILSERDVVRGLCEYGDELPHLTAGHLMTREVRFCAPQDDLSRILHEMTVHRIRHLPVVEQGRLFGLVSIGDVVKHRFVELQTEASVLRDNYFASH